MKILQINKYHYLRGGSESVYFNTSELLKQHGHEILFFATKHPKNIHCDFDHFFADAPEIRDLSTLHKIAGISRFFRNRDAECKLDRLLTDNRPDIAHIHNFFNGLGLGILKVLHKHNIPVVISLHDARFICPSVRLMNNPQICNNCQKHGYLPCLTNKCYEDSLPLSTFTMLEMMHKEWLFKYDKYIDQYIFLSKRFRTLFSDRHDYFANKGSLLYNFNPNLHYVEPSRGNYVLFYARICQEKGINTLLDAIQKTPDIQYVMAGTGPLENAVRLKKPDNLQMPGFVSGKDLENLIKGSSFVIVPSEWEENNPMTVIEAYGYSKPVIGSNRGGIPEIVSHGKTGFVFPQKNVTDLVEVINKATTLSDTDYFKMAENARQFAINNFNAEVHYKRLIEIYNKAIRQHK